MSANKTCTLLKRTAGAFFCARVLALAFAAALPLAAMFGSSALAGGLFTTTAPLAWVPADWMPQPQSFAERFDCPQKTRIRQSIAWSIEHAEFLADTAAFVDRDDIVAAGPPVIGIASTYDPDESDADSGEKETASGELYDAADWTAAIRIDLRDQFGGIGFGTSYRASFALVEAADKQVIVRINDVGQLVPGRIIDLNQRTMRYFDPTLQLGLLSDVRVTPLAGAHWTPGPVMSELRGSILARADR